MEARDHDVLFIPGPVEVDAELREIMAMPLVGHRSQRFKQEALALCTKLKALFLTEATTFFENCPATALMEAAVRNLVERRILHLTCGAFSERWLEISKSAGREAEAVAAHWGSANSTTALRDALRRSGPFEAVAITHNETSTGVINPLRALIDVVREESADSLVLVDAVTSLAGSELRFDAWGIDVAFAGTQKALALPPGLCVFAVSDRAMAKAAKVANRGYLLDFLRARDGLAKGETVATPCVPLVFALSRQLDRVAQEGLEQRWRRHAEMREMVEAWANEHRFEWYASPGAHSPTVSCLKASGRDVPTLVAAARKAGFVMDGGYGKLKGQTFRIGHMGDHSLARVQELLAAIA